ncbi:hypothetical protein AAII07_24040 [Microvirga sp. 0TCS3.31]
MAILIRRLISQPFDLEHNGSDKGRNDEEGHNGREGPILNSGVHPNQRDQQQSRNAKGDGGKDVERVR